MCFEEDKQLLMSEVMTKVCSGRVALTTDDLFHS